MIFKQYRFEPLNQASYFLACWRKGLAFIVDPIEDLGPDHYRREAASFALTIQGVLETHVPADFVSCAQGLAEAFVAAGVRRAQDARLALDAEI